MIIDEMRVRGNTEETLLPRVKSCLAEAIAIAGELKESTGGGSTFATIDIGRFGSKSWKERDSPSQQMKQKIFKTVQQTVMDELLRTNLNFGQYEDLFVNVTGGRDDPGYVAALHRVIASRADCLVIVGGGNFMEVALEQYLHNHPSHARRCVHFVCVSRRFRDEYRQLMEQSQVNTK